MQLRTLLIVAFGPALAVCQPQPAVAGSLNNDNKWADGFLADETTECAAMPSMPGTFVAKRVFWSVFNTIVFEDRHGKEFGFVESWLWDAKNLFGYPGASFYLKAEPQVAADGLFNLDGPTPGQDGTFENNPLTNQATANQQQMQGAPQAMAQNNQGKGFFGSFFRSVEGNQHYRLAAYMVGNQASEPFGKPWLDEMQIMDCKGQLAVQAQNGALIFRKAKDARYYQSRTNTENALIIEDLGQPPQVLVRIAMKEPCRPFPPFCAEMGMWNWFIHGYTWEGMITTPSDSSTLGGISALNIQISTSSGEAEDMRFLTLYSAYQFSNTRWSPFMNIIWWILFFAPIFCCCWRSWWCCLRCGDAPKADFNEETQKLMQTQEIEMGTKVPEMKSSGGFMACCSRRGGRGIAAN